MAFNKAADKEGAPMKRRPMHRRKKVCVFCGKDKILPRRITGNCAKHQRALTVAIKRARHVALMPYVCE